jgi:hypothetical protein
MPATGKPMSLQQLQQLMRHVRPWIAAEAAMMVSHHAVQQPELTRTTQTAEFAGIQVDLAFTPSHVAFCCGCKDTFMDMQLADEPQPTRAGCKHPRIWGVGTRLE